MLTIDNLEVFYGAVQAVHVISLEVNEGEIVTLIGGNGAGKSTTLKTISGLVRPRSGSLTFEGKDLTKLPPDLVVRMGICQVPEGRRVFAEMSVRENLELGGYTRESNMELKRDLEHVLSLFPRLGERLDQRAGTLSGGEQQMLAMGRALMSRPRLLLLDEPSLGLAPFLVKEIFRIIREINEEGTTILLVEQNAHQALAIAKRGYVLETGRVILSDDAPALLGNEMVRKAYLGEQD